MARATAVAPERALSTSSKARPPAGPAATKGAAETRLALAAGALSSSRSIRASSHGSRNPLLAWIVPAGGASSTRVCPPATKGLLSRRDSSLMRRRVLSASTGASKGSLACTDRLLAELASAYACTSTVDPLAPTYPSVALPPPRPAGPVTAVPLPTPAPRPTVHPGAPLAVEMTRAPRAKPETLATPGAATTPVFPSAVTPTEPAAAADTGSGRL